MPLEDYQSAVSVMSHMRFQCSLANSYPLVVLLNGTYLFRYGTNQQLNERAVEATSLIHSPDISAEDLPQQRYRVQATNNMFQAVWVNPCSLDESL